ncbi:MAG: polymerase sigma-70 factor, subfamily [Candidatus Taylorbacteria bacterium]|nr:polymerase sigma-70 factor, subfamily [Candidatus Taylorbacteria bacterium]
MNSSLEKAFIDLYAKEADAVFRFCLMRTSNRDVARDLTQEAFTKIWTSMQDGIDIQNMRAFVFKVSRNLLIDWYRKKKPSSLDAMADEDIHGEIALVEDGAEMAAEMSAEARFLIAKIGELEPAYQQVVYLRFVEDLKPQEIADALGESVNVISVRITRGIEKLRQMTGYEKENSK